MANRKYIIKQLNNFFAGCRDVFKSLRNCERSLSVCMKSFFLNYFLSCAYGGNLQAIDEGRMTDND
ncbi:MAG: hypothetical protein AB1546_11720 [bacterium]